MHHGQRGRWAERGIGARVGNHANAPVPRAGHLDQRRKCRPWVASEVRDNQRGTRAFLGSPMQIVVGEQLSALRHRSEEHTSELQSLMRNSSAVFCLKKQKAQTKDLTS